MSTYSDHDPETGCGLLIVCAILALIVVAVVVVWKFHLL